MTTARALTIAADMTIATSIRGAIAMMTDSLRLLRESEQTVEAILCALEQSDERTDVHPAPELTDEQSDGVPVQVMRETIEGGA
jgi:hypothetical protein